MFSVVVVGSDSISSSSRLLAIMFSMRHSILPSIRFACKYFLDGQSPVPWCGLLCHAVLDHDVLRFSSFGVLHHTIPSQPGISLSVCHAVLCHAVSRHVASCHKASIQWGTCALPCWMVLILCYAVLCYECRHRSHMWGTRLCWLC